MYNGRDSCPGGSEQATTHSMSNTMNTRSRSGFSIVSYASTSLVRVHLKLLMKKSPHEPVHVNVVFRSAFGSGHIRFKASPHLPRCRPMLEIGEQIGAGNNEPPFADLCFEHQCQVAVFVPIIHNTNQRS